MFAKYTPVQIKFILNKYSTKKKIHQFNIQIKRPSFSSTHLLIRSCCLWKPIWRSTQRFISGCLFVALVFIRPLLFCPSAALSGNRNLSSPPRFNTSRAVTWCAHDSVHKVDTASVCMFTSLRKWWRVELLEHWTHTSISFAHADWSGFTERIFSAAHSGAVLDCWWFRCYYVILDYSGFVSISKA